ncbi:hypothetical protein CC78DRAFT_610913 [Lojkania enalia]|uniref:Uncharacterized protein n=1 Tax=Lojkania enalia TaxID=147567 RepID=A0A9P4TRD8_9PLEO|nr:hypothetical protein CC78DRAFT_610913 [Didymosphaeria enalia]
MAETNQHRPPRHQDSGFYEAETDSTSSSSSESATALFLPPRIVGRSAAVSRQTIPNWAGLLIIIAVIVWTTWCAIYIFSLFGAHKRRGSG